MRTTRTRESNLNEVFPEKVCPICKKSFVVPVDRNLWVYKRGKGNGLLFYCSWHCLREHESKLKPHKGYSSDLGVKVVERIKANVDQDEICREFGISRATVSYWKRRVKIGKEPRKSVYDENGEPRQRESWERKGVGNQVIAMLQENCTRKEICDKLGISKTTVSYWRQQLAMERKQKESGVCGPNLSQK